MMILPPKSQWLPVRKYYVYAIEYGSDVVYVGASTNPKKRANGDYSFTPFAEWFKRNRNQFSIRVLETCDYCAIYKRELAWIRSLHEQGNPLFNRTGIHGRRPRCKRAQMEIYQSMCEQLDCLVQQKVSPR